MSVRESERVCVCKWVQVSGRWRLDVTRGSVKQSISSSCVSCLQLWRERNIELIER